MAKDDVSGLPDVSGLTEFVAQNLEGTQATPPQTQTPPQVSQPTDTTVKVDGKTVQFKTAEEAFRAYTEVQAFAQRLADENKKYQEQLKSMNEMMELMRMQQVPYVQPQGAPQHGNFDAQFIQNPEAAIEAKVEQKVLTARIADTLGEEESKNPQEFQSRYAYAKLMARQYPNLANNPAGVKKLFELGDRQRQDDMKRNASQAVQMIFGDDVDLEKLKALASKNGSTQPSTSNLAYMPDTGFPTGVRPQPQNKTIDTMITEAASKGDIDATVSNVFAKVLNETK